MKKMLVFFFAAGVLALSPTSGLFADRGRGECPYMHSSRSHDGKQEQGCPITGKLKKKAHFYLEHQKELALIDEQVAQIKEIKLAAKKSHIRQMAEMQVFSLDIQHKMAETPVDVEGIHAMIDQTSAAMTASAKENLNSFVQLKAILTPEQTAKAKELWLEQKN